MVTGSRYRVRRLVSAAVVLGWALWALSGAAYAQGFMVKPMRLDVTAPPGRTVDLQVGVRNTTSTATTVLISTMELGQSDQGAWIPVDLSKGEVDPARLRSCLTWLTLGDNSLDIPPMDSRNVSLRLKVPFGVHGSYAASLNVRTKAPKPQPNKVAVVVQFVIPVIVNVQGPPAKENLVLAGIGMEYVEATDKNPATTQVYLQARNDGETYARLGGKIGLMYQARGRWRLISNIPVRESGTIPGFAIKLIGDTKRRLPSGQYRLSGILTVNGRQRARIEKDVEFQGDPALQTIAADVTLDINPLEISLKGVPGNHQLTVLSVRNMSDETLKIECATVTPGELRGVAMGSLTGADFDCASWVQVSPPSLELAGNQRRNFKIEVAIPKEGVTQPNYYATLIMRASYPDGQSGGETKLDVWVQNAKAKSQAKAEAIRAAIALQEENKYAVTAQFGNVGNIHFTPTVSATLATPIGQILTTVQLETTSTRVLPLGTPTFSGVLDLEKVAAGLYMLTCTMRYADQDVSTQLPLQVEEKDGQKVVTVLERLPETPAENAGGTPSQ